MKIDYYDFEKIISDKIRKEGGKSQHVMINGGIMKLWLSDEQEGIVNSRYPKLCCQFEILYAIYEKALSLGGKMHLGANAAHNGKRIGSEGLSTETIDGFISTEYYGKNIGDKTLRRSTYYAAILDWAGFAKNHRGGFITINKEYMDEV